MPAFAADPQTGTVTDPFYADLVTVLFVAIAVVFIGVAICALIRESIRRWREASAQLDQDIVDALNDAELYSSPRSLPRTTRVRWYPDTETPVGNQLLREYVGGRP